MRVYDRGNMPNGENRRPSLLQSLQNFQASVQEAGPAAIAGYSLIGSVGVLGALGYGFDRWFGTWPWGLVSGV